MTVVDLNGMACLLFFFAGIFLANEMWFDLSISLATGLLAFCMAWAQSRKERN